MEKELPKLRPNQIGISCKTIYDSIGPIKVNDDILYFTISSNDISIELYPEKPIIIIDKDAIKMILEKIKQVEDNETIPPPKPIKERSNLGI